MSTTPTPVEDDLGTGRMITSRWRPATLRMTPSKEDRGLFDHPRGLPWMLNVEMTTRSEERRVGEECRSRWSPYH